MAYFLPEAIVTLIILTSLSGTLTLLKNRILLQLAQLDRRTLLRIGLGNTLNAARRQNGEISPTVRAIISRHMPADSEVGLEEIQVASHVVRQLRVVASDLRTGEQLSQTILIPR